MQITVMTPRRVTLLVPMARRSTLLLVSPPVWSLATPASRKRRFRMAMAEPDDEPERRPGRREQERDQDSGRPDDDGGHHRAAEHLGQRVALEVREPVEHVHAPPATDTCGSA